MIKVAPTVFLGSWDFVESGYLHPGGVFIISTIAGKEYHVYGKENIEETIEIWRKKFPELAQETAREGIPAEIAFWLGNGSKPKQASHANQ